MKVVAADTSFLFSLFGGDAHTDAARTWALENKQAITVTEFNRFEFGNAVRFAAFRKLVSRKDATASLGAFEADLNRGVLQLESPDLIGAVREAARLSESYTLAGGHRSFDILHLAAARILGAAQFLSFDVNQRKLARLLALPVGP